jgi:hypothetical protein
MRAGIREKEENPKKNMEQEKKFKVMQHLM